MFDWQRQPAWWVRALYPGALFREGEDVHLTFDDGPCPEHTPWLLERLREANVRATWFVVGHNCERHPELLRAIVAAGHEVGNHTYDHVARHHTTRDEYKRQIGLCGDVVERLCGARPRLFRPPHGLFAPWESCRPLRLTLWDVMPEDYNERLSPGDVVAHLRRLTRAGSVVVLHDSPKGGARMRAAVEWLLERPKS